MINSVIPETHTLSLKLLHPISSSLTHLHSLSLFNSLPWCRPVTISTLSSHMVSYYHQVFSHTTCALIPSHLTECSLTLSFHQLPISWCPTTTKSSLTTCALIVIPHTQVILLTDHSHVLSLIISLSDLTTSSLTPCPLTHVIPACSHSHGVVLPPSVLTPVLSLLFSHINSLIFSLMFHYHQVISRYP